MPTPLRPSRKRKARRNPRSGSGAPATPHKPWTERKVEWLAKIEERGSIGVNRKWCSKTYRNDVTGRDLRRLIKEGLVRLTEKGGINYRRLEVTEKGRTVLPPKNLARIPDPYAKRKAAILADKQRANGVPLENPTSLWA